MGKAPTHTVLKTWWSPGQTGWEILSWSEFLQKQTLQVVDQRSGRVGRVRQREKQANKGRVVRPLPAPAPNTASQSTPGYPIREGNLSSDSCWGLLLRALTPLNFQHAPCVLRARGKKKKKASGRGLQVWAVSRFLQVEMKAKGTWLSTERACGDSVVSLWFRSLGGASLSSVARGCGPCRVLPCPLPPRPPVRWAVRRLPSCGDWGGYSPFSAAASLGHPRKDSLKA